MNEVLLAIAAGFIVGVLFSFLKLPIPAPPVLSGVMGIVGVYLGALLTPGYSHVSSLDALSSTGFARCEVPLKLANPACKQGVSRLK
mgnify:CR=1 FL=1